MKTEIQISPNRERGYDAFVFIGRDREHVHTSNAPSEAKARELAQAWIAAQPKPARRPRVLSDRAYESECETREAARNEESAHGRD